MSATAKTVIIPAAGKGTRLLPATRVTAKELLPVYDRPVIAFAIDEALEAGAERIIVVISPGKTAIADFLGRDVVQDDLGRQAEVVYVVQEQPLGLGHAVLCCESTTLPGLFGVILPDDIIMGQACLPEMIAHLQVGQMVAAMKVTAAQTAQYGIFRLGGMPSGRCIPVAGMVEKPAPGTAPSSIAAVGRYILDPMIFEVLAHTPVGAGGELQLTDAIGVAINAVQMTAFQFTGTRYDCGSHDGLLSASVARQSIVKAGLVSGFEAANTPISGGLLAHRITGPGGART
jgi:UTP--glucose-1-phosphate uridylyltransferase